MTIIEIDTELGYGFVETQVYDLETEQLLEIYDLLETNPSLYTTISNELMHRGEHDYRITEEQIEEVEQRLR